jgi:Fe-S cluster assembly protein SufD
MSTPATRMDLPVLPDWIEAAAAPRSGEPGWLGARRRAALEQFRGAGFPGRRDEAWKYTSLRLLERRSFTSMSGPVAAPATGRIGAIHGLDGPRLVFVNGRLVEADALPDGLTAVPLVDADARVAEPLLGRIADPTRHRFAGLNLACFAGGLLLDLPAGLELDAPLRLVFLSDGGREPALSCPRLLVRAGANSRATVIEHYFSGEGETLCCATTEAALGPGSRLVHYRLQEESAAAFHLGVLAARLERDATFVSHNLSVGARLARLDLDVLLHAPGAAVEMNGLYIAGGRQHMDSHTRVDHAAPRTTSDEIYRGVLTDKSRAVFNGRAIVHPGADGTDAKQSNANLLLSPDAEVDTKPELEIYADDVKCSHGATTGQLDAEALFYLRSRGLDQETAQSLLTFAFADAVLARMGLEPVRRHAERLVTGRLPDSERIQEFT